jgi:ferrous iron transport protein A
VVFKWVSYIKNFKLKYRNTSHLTSVSFTEKVTNVEYFKNGFCIIYTHFSACVRRKILRTLKDAKVGETVTVVKLHGQGPVKRRIMDMGVTKGVIIFIRKVAPLGDPVEVNIRDYELSLRKSDCEMIEIV